MRTEGGYWKKGNYFYEFLMWEKKGFFLSAKHSYTK